MPADSRRGEYFDKLKKLLSEYPRIILVGCDNIGSNHMQKIRQSIRGEAVLLMGKKTMMRKALREACETNPHLEHLIPHVHGNIGFVFTKGDLTEIRNKLTDLKVEAPAKVGVVAPNDVIVPAGPTGMEPTQTTFLQALNIASKINRGQVEILSPCTLVHAGEKVGQSEATLLSRLNIRPFRYALVPTVVYDNGSVYDQKVLDMTDEDVEKIFSKGIQNVAGLCLAAGYPTEVSVPHSVINGFKNALAIAVATEYSFPLAEKMKEMIEHPELFASAAAPVAAEAKEEAKEEVKEEEPEEEEEEDGDLGLDLFGF